MADRPPFPIYIIPFVVLALALAAYALGGLAGLAAAGAAPLCALLGLRWLFARMRQAAIEACALDAQVIQSQKLATIGEMASGIAHEINNPLAIIGQEADLIRQLLPAKAGEGDAFPAADIDDGLREILSQVNRCGDITHKLLSLARKMDPVFQTADAHKLIEDMATLVEREAKKRGVRIERRYAPDISPVHTDPPLFRQVVINLLTNALHVLSPAGQGTIVIETHPEKDGGVRVVVSDDGPGIPDDLLPKIFDPFFTTKAPGQGTGLGLSLCHRIMDRLGGRIFARNLPEGGAQFTVTLPPAANNRT